MLKKTKDEHIKNMMKELSEVKISTKEGESPYLVDYLYGVSDVEKEIKEYFESYFSSEEEWILISRVLISREILKKKEYHKISTGNSEYFLMRDLEDIIKFLDCQIKCNNVFRPRILLGAFSSLSTSLVCCLSHRPLDLILFSLTF